MTEEARTASPPTRLGAAVDTATVALQSGLRTIAEVHAAIAGKPFRALRLAPGVGEASELVRVVHDGITGLAYAGVAAAVGVAGAAARLATTFVEADDEPSPGSATDLALAAINGFAGDRLAGAANPLAIPMGLRHEGRWLTVERDALAAVFPGSPRRLAIFVHGLASSESLWHLDAERHYGDRRSTIGARLQRDLGYAPLYLRYNTGRHVSENGRELAALLEDLVRRWPVPVDEIALVGHSMGGLVLRSACHYGREGGAEWTRAVRHVVFLGSPHLGAPLEKAANVGAWVLGLSDVTRPIARLLNGRSGGIKDLRFGSLLDEDWKDADLDALLAGRTGEVPFLAGAHHYFVVAVLTHDPRHPFGVAVGDLLVRVPSASGGGRFRHHRVPLGRSRLFGSMHHLELLNHPRVYEQMRRWLECGAEAPSALRPGAPAL